MKDPATMIPSLRVWIRATYTNTPDFCRQQGLLWQILNLGCWLHWRLDIFLQTELFRKNKVMVIATFTIHAFLYTFDMIQWSYVALDPVSRRVRVVFVNNNMHNRVIEKPRISNSVLPLNFFNKAPSFILDVFHDIKERSGSLI